MEPRRPTWAIFLLATLAFVATTLLATRKVVAAQPDPSQAHPKVSIVVEGPEAKKLRSDIVQGLPSELEAVDAKTFDGALSKAGQFGQVSTQLDQVKQSPKAATKIQKAARAVGAVVTIVARSVATKGKKQIQFFTVRTEDASVVWSDRIEKAPVEDERREAIRNALAGPLSEFVPKKEPEPTPAAVADNKAEPPPPEEPPAEKLPAHEPGRELFRLAVGFQLAGRWFSYSDGITANLRPYDVFPAPMINASGDLYPLARTTVPVAKDIGVSFRYRTAIGVTSKTAGGDPIPTQFWRLDAALRGRTRFLDDRLLIGLSGGVGKYKFSFENAGILENEIPFADLLFARGALDGKVLWKPFFVTLDAAYLLPVAKHGVYDRFRDASVAGVEGSLGLGLLLGAGFELNAGAEYTRFFSSFGPVPGDPYVAGGAVDELLSAALNVAYAY